MSSDKTTTLKLKKVENIDDDRLGRCTLYQQEGEGPDLPLIICKEKILANQKELENHKSWLETRKKSKGYFLVPLIDYEAKEVSNLCATHYSLKVYLPFTEDNLENQIRIQSTRKQLLSETDMTFALYQSLMGLSQLHALNSVHGCIKPAWIVRTKIGYSLLEDPLKERKELYDLSNRENIFASPEQFAEASKFKVGNYDRSKTDIFSLGLTLLAAASLEPISEIYEAKTQTVNFGILNTKLAHLERLYPTNPLFCSSVRLMLERDEFKRPSAERLLHEMPPFDQVRAFLARPDQGFLGSKYTPVSAQDVGRFSSDHQQVQDQPLQLPRHLSKPIDEQVSYTVPLKPEDQGPPLPLIPPKHILPQPTSNDPSFDNRYQAAPVVNPNRLQPAPVPISKTFSVNQAHVSNPKSQPIHNQNFLNAPFDPETGAFLSEEAISHSTSQYSRPPQKQDVPFTGYINVQKSVIHEAPPEFKHSHTRIMQMDDGPLEITMAENLKYPHQGLNTMRNVPVLEQADPAKIQTLLIDDPDIDVQAKEYSEVKKAKLVHKRQR